MAATGFVARRPERRTDRPALLPLPQQGDASSRKGQQGRSVRPPFRTARNEPCRGHSPRSFARWCRVALNRRAPLHRLDPENDEPEPSVALPGPDGPAGKDGPVGCTGKTAIAFPGPNRTYFRMEWMICSATRRATNTAKYSWPVRAST